MPQTLIYAQSFLLIGIYWMAHHRMFRYIQHYDATLVWLNTLFLLCVAFLPVPSKVLGEYYMQPAAIIFYALALLVTSLASLLLWRYATQAHRLVAADLDAATIRYPYKRGLMTAVVALLAILLTFVSVRAALGVWALWALVSTPLGRLWEPRHSSAAAKSWRLPVGKKP